MQKGFKCHNCGTHATSYKMTSKTRGEDVWTCLAGSNCRGVANRCAVCPVCSNDKDHMKSLMHSCLVQGTGEAAEPEVAEGEAADGEGEGEGGGGEPNLYVIVKLRARLWVDPYNQTKVKKHGEWDIPNTSEYEICGRCNYDPKVTCLCKICNN